MDLAISEKQTADYTAIVGGYRVVWNSQSKILILPHPVKSVWILDTNHKDSSKYQEYTPLW